MPFLLNKQTCQWERGKVLRLYNIMNILIKRCKGTGALIRKNMIVYLDENYCIMYPNWYHSADYIYIPFGIIKPILASLKIEFRLKRCWKVCVCVCVLGVAVGGGRGGEEVGGVELR